MTLAALPDDRTIFEAASDGLIITDPETGMAVAANSAFCRMHRCDAADVIGLPPSRFVAESERETQPSYVATVLTGDDVRARTRGRRLDGTTFPVDLHATLISFDGRPHLLAVVRDMTEIEVAQAELEERIADRARELTALLALARSSSATLDPRALALRPETVEQEGLVGALRRQIEVVQARGGLRVTAQLPPEPNAPLPVKEALYRIAQEALHNVVQHAQAATVTLRLAAEPGALVLDVADDGAGFDPATPRPGHVGQRSMREWATTVGGTLTVDSAPGHGTRLRAVARVPA